MSQCQNNAKKRSLKLLCAVFIIQKLREGEFGFGWTIWTFWTFWTIWTALAPIEPAAVLTVIYCQMSETFLQSIIKLININ